MVRVISGTAGGLRLRTIDSENTKPTLDRVKEAMFAILMPWIKDSVVIDVFAGNGSLGIEALSRGAVKAYFNDRNRICCNIIKENLVYTHFENNGVVYNLDYELFIEKLQEQNVKAGVIILDPPYGRNLIELTLDYLSEYNICDIECAIMAEHAVSDVVSDEIGAFTRIKYKKYGNVALSLFTRKE